MSNDNVLMDFLVQEAGACKSWIKQCERKHFEFFYNRVLTSLQEIGIVNPAPGQFYNVPLAMRMEELERLETHHRLELEAAFIAVWLSKDMKQIREDYHKQNTIDVLHRL
jgi:hypothetical protein